MATTKPLSEHMIPATELVAYLEDRIARAEAESKQHSDIAGHEAQTPESARYWILRSNEEADEADVCRGILRAVVRGEI